MNIEDAIEPITALKRQSAELIKKVRDTKHPIIITQNGKAAAILQDIDSFERQRKALFLLKFLAQGDEDYRQGRSIAHDDVKAHVTAKVEELKRRVQKV